MKTPRWPSAPATWLALLAPLAAIAALALASLQPPSLRADPEPASQAQPRCSARRALETIRVLADEIGPHPIGSPGLERAARYLLGELRAIPRLEVELQRAHGEVRHPLFPAHLLRGRVVNVLARLPGRRSDAILLSAHFDSPFESPGASDDGIGTAAALEVLRVLAAGPPLERSVVLCLNGGEEAGQLGSSAFRRHRWFRDLRAWVDFEGSGSGKASLIVATSRHPALLETYARVAPAPEANILFDDLARRWFPWSSEVCLAVTRCHPPGSDGASRGAEGRACRRPARLRQSRS